MQDGSSDIRNHFVTVNGRKMHYRHAGAGPVVVMLHASPTSAKVMEPVQKIYATDFSTIAVDLPGFGLSEPLGKDVLKTEDLADAVVALLDVLGIEQAAFYGRHTGAGVAVELAHRHPARVSMVLADGFPVFEKPYSDERLEEYLGSIDPKFDGSHLLWVWFRYRDLYVFWPWDKRSATARADTSMPAVESLHRGALEMLEAGNEFRKVYASAFRHAGLKMIGEVKPPVCYGNRPGDSQYHTMKKYPASAWTMEFPREQAAASVKEREVLKQHPARSAFTPPENDFHPGNLFPDVGYVAFEGRQTLVRTRGFGQAGVPTLLLHDLPGSSALHAAMLDQIGARRPAFAVDLLGQGESRTSVDNEVCVETWARQARSAISSLGLGRVNVVAYGAAAAVAVELARTSGNVVASLVLQSPPAFSATVRDELVEKYPVAADPVWDGGHLTRVFHHLRDQELWWPWYHRVAANIRKNEPQIDPSELTLRVRECVKQPRFYKRATEEALRYPLVERLPLLTSNVIVARCENDRFESGAAMAAALARASDVLLLPADAKGQAAALLGVLE